MTCQPGHNRKLTAAACLVFLLAGCTGARHRQLEPGQPYWFEYPAHRRGAILVPYDRDSRDFIHFCAEPSPDVGMQLTGELLGKATTPQGITAEAQAKLRTELVQLAGRTSQIVFLREALYRLCEQSLNGNLRRDEIEPLFRQILAAALKLSEAQLTDAIKTAPAATLPAIGEALQPASTP